MTITRYSSIPLKCRWWWVESRAAPVHPGSARDSGGDL